MLRKVSDSDTVMSGSDDPNLTAVAVEARPKQKRSLSLCHMILLNSVVCGVEVCACAGFTYITPILLKAGFSEEKMSFLLGIGPFLGIFVVPLIGRSSDHCRSRFGRRRPYIFVIGIGCVVAMFIIPYSASITYKLGTVMSYSKILFMFFLAFGVVLFDFSTLICLNPCEALLSDLSRGTTESDRIFIVYSTMISVGGCIGYLITALDWTGSSVSVYMGGQEQSIFAILLVVFTVTLLVSLFVGRERQYGSRLAINGTTHNESGYESSSSESSGNDDDKRHIPPTQASSKTTSNRPPSMKPTFGKSAVKRFCGVVSLMERVTVSLCHKSVTHLCIETRKRVSKACSRLSRRLAAIVRIPVAVRYLVVSDMISWMNIMCFTYFFSDFMGQSVYAGSPSAEANSPLSLLYDQGVRAASMGLLLHCIVAAFYAPVVERLMHKIGPRRTMTLSMAVGSFAMMVICFIRSPTLVICMAALTGFSNAALTIIPYTLMTEYHRHKALYFYDTPMVNVDEDDDERGIAGDFAILDCSYFMGDVILALTIGYIIQLTGTTVTYMVVAALMGVLSCIMMQRIVTSKDEMTRLIQRLAARDHVEVI